MEQTCTVFVLALIISGKVMAAEDTCFPVKRKQALLPRNLSNTPHCLFLNRN